MPAVTLISALPVHVSPEEHRELVASTPQSFGDIPPVLRYKEDGVKVTFEPPVDGFADEDGKQGTLYVLESALIYISATGRGFQVLYPSITLHAVSRSDAGAGPSIYCQLDESPAEADAAIPGPDEDEEFEMREMSIVPRDPSTLDLIFEALSLCASLHPDPHDADEDDLDDAFLDPDTATFEAFTGSEDQELSEAGRAALDYLDSIIVNPFEKPTQEDGEFDDAKSEQATGAHVEAAKW